MTRQPDIWSRLQEYEVPPPQGIAERVWEIVNAEKKDGDNGDEQMKGCMERLGQVAIQPPPSLRSSVEKTISKTAAAPVRGGSTTAGSSGRSLSFYGIRSVAACLVLTLAGWLIYRATISKGAPVAVQNKKIAAGSPAGKETVVLQPDSLSRKESLNQADSLNDLAEDLPAADSNVLVKTGRYRQHFSFHINGQRFPLVDNDLLITFASFKYNEIPDFVNRTDNESWMIRIDQYANIVISKTMVGMMKEMSGFKSNGNPTRKARKSRDKLDKWKKTDADNFDQSVQKNPLDPIDLAEFIFK
jgi:hypothetical protein